MSWIQDRAGFNVDAVFHAMIEIVQRNINEMNELRRSQGFIGTCVCILHSGRKRSFDPRYNVGSRGRTEQA